MRENCSNLQQIEASEKELHTGQKKIKRERRFDERKATETIKLVLFVIECNILLMYKASYREL